MVNVILKKIKYLIMFLMCMGMLACSGGSGSNTDAADSGSGGSGGSGDTGGSGGSGGSEEAVEPNIQLSINSQPTSLSTEVINSVDFSAVANLGLQQVECNLNSQGFSVCTSPLQISNQENGSYSLQLRATDQEGNQSSVVTVNWEVNTALTPKRITGGNEFFCYITPSQTVKCWGKNDLGQLGNAASSGTNQSSPVDVDGLTNVVSLSAGSDHVCALLSDRSVSCWGGNDAAQLGRGSNNYTANPTPQDIGLTDVVQLSMGFKHSCVLLLDGNMQCFGSNDTFELGFDSSGNAVTTPTTVLSNVTMMSAGGRWPNYHSCALVNSGQVYCWGDNNYGQMGQGTASATPVSTPTLVSSLSNVTHIASGDRYNCAALNTGALWCWGENSSGQLGLGSVSSYESTPSLVGSFDFADMVLTYAHTCLAETDGSVSCWGVNWAGQLGQGYTWPDHYSPTSISGLTDVVAVAGGGSTSCSLSSSDTVSCWGSNSSGEVGNGTTATPISSPDSTVSSSL